MTAHDELSVVRAIALSAIGGDMPTPKKPAAKRQRTNKPKKADAQIVALNTATTPEAPRVSKALTQEWDRLWSSELAAHWNQDTDLLAMRRLFGLYDRIETYEKQAAKQGSVSTGSTGQLKMHPLLQAADSLRGQILALEDRFGLTPMARLKLGIALGEAAVSIQKLNESLRGDRPDEEVEDDDDDEEFQEVIEADFS